MTTNDNNNGNEILDKALQEELDRLKAAIVQLQQRAANITALLGSQPGQAPASLVAPPVEQVSAEQAHGWQVLTALSKAPEGMAIGEIAKLAGTSKDVARRIMAGLAKSKQAIRKGDRALARWYAK